MAKDVRIGKVSKIDYKNGMVSATYIDMDDDVTDEFPVFSMGDEYKMPEVGDEVLVLHLSNGSTAGIVMGRYWNEDNQPAKYGKGVFRKELAHDAGEAYLQYLHSGKQAQLYADKVVLSCSAGSVTVAQIINLLARVSKLESYH